MMVAMKMPLPGELWSDEVTWAVKRKPRLVLVTEVDGEMMRGRGIVGDGTGDRGVPLGEVSRTWTWQGYWSLQHETLPTLTPPYEGHLLAGIPKAGAAAKLHGTADLVNAIVPSLSPHSAYGYDRDRKPTAPIHTEKPVTSIPAGTAYLELTFRAPTIAAPGTMVVRPARLLALWYQRQRSAWHLVRTLIVASPHLVGDLRR